MEAYFITLAQNIIQNHNTNVYDFPDECLVSGIDIKHK